MKVESERYELYDFRLDLGSAVGSPNTSSLLSALIGIVVSSVISFECRDDADAANKGAGGSGRLGLPPYFDDGVPGLGLPFISAGSYAASTGGGRLEGVHGLVGELRPEDVCA